MRRAAHQEATVDQQGLVERARDGDRDAFTALIDMSIAKLDTAARLTLRDPDLARDAVQDALVRAWRNLPALRNPERFDAWLYRLTINACLDLARRRQRRRIEVDLSTVDLGGAVDVADGVADRDLIDAVLQRLDAPHRAVIVMHFYLGMSMADVASSLGIPAGTARSRLHYSLAAMRGVVVADTVAIPTPQPVGRIA
jgi:RNA polymerase sigma-70 factor, ECF subfamily